MHMTTHLQKYGRLFAFLPLLLLVFGGTVQAQNLRSDRTAYLSLRAGLASYLGDNEETPFNFNFDMFDAGFPYSVGAELGYQFTPAWGLGVFYQLGNYTTIAQNLSQPDPTGLDANLYRRSHVGLRGRYTFGAATSRVAPYLQAGVQYTFGDVAICATQPRPATLPVCVLKNNVSGRLEEKSKGFVGPHAGVGLDIRLARQVSLLVEYSTNIITDDDVLDGVAEDGGFAGFDMFNFFGLGLKIDFKAPFVPVQVLSLEGPQALETNQQGTFTATVNEAEATQPITYAWDFGDGTTGTGVAVTHSYARAGTYTVTFTATNGNGRGSDSRTLTVTVRAPVPAQIVTLTATPSRADTRTPVRFTANVQGDQPITYSWDFGDGNTSTEAAPTHTFSEPGTYTVRLTVTNEAGSDTRTVSVVVDPYEPPYCATLTEMNTVFFDRNSSTLTAEARQALQENVEVLRECVSINARLEGFAAPGERNAQQLSEDRARAVEQFYIDNGILASRLTAVGMGRVEGMTSKKSGASEARRVDTIPIR